MTVEAGRLDPWLETPRWLVPRPTDEDREFWEGAARGVLRIQHCSACRRYQHYPRMLCSHCGADAVAWADAGGGGTIHSFTVIRQNGLPPFSERVPFVVALIELDEPGARILAALPTLAVDAARIGLRVQCTFRTATDELAFVDFAAVDE